MEKTKDDTTGVSFDDVIQVLYIIFAILGILGNGLVLVVMIRIRSLRTITNLFITNQSIIDFLSSVFLLALIYNPRKINFAALPDTTWSEILCYFWHSQYIFWSLLATSTTNLIVLTLERYIAVVFPVIYRNRASYRTASGFVIVPWILGFLFQLYWPVAHHLVDGVCYPSYGNKTNQVILGILIFIVKLMAPVIIMFVVYSAILRKIKPKSEVAPENQSTIAQGMGAIAGVSSEQRGADDNLGGKPPNGPTPSNRLGAPVSVALSATSTGDRNAIVHSPRINGDTAAPTAPIGDTRSGHFSHRIRMNVIKTLLIVTIVFALCWTPIQVVFLLYNLGILNTSGTPYTDGTPYKVTVVIVFINIWINPVIYAFKYRRFQDGLRKTLGLRQKTDPSHSTQLSSRP